MARNQLEGFPFHTSMMDITNAKVLQNGILVDLDTALQNGASNGGAVINVLDYGAEANNASVNNATAFSAAWADFKAALSLTTQFVGATLVIPSGVYYASSSVNWTGDATTFLGWNAEIYARGAVLRSNVSGKPAIDMTGIRGVEIDGLSIWGDPTNKPSCGLSLGPRNTDTCGNNYFRRMKIMGEYTKAAVVNHGSETTVWDNCYFVNSNADAATYAFIADGSNQFGLTSDYAALRSTGTPVSFTNNRFLNNCRFQKDTAGSAIYLEYTTGWDFCRSNYVLAFDASGVVVYQSAASRNSGLHLRGLFETTQGSGLDYVMTVVTPDGGSSAIEGFELDCHIPHASVAIIRQVRESDYGDMTSGSMYIRGAEIICNGYTGASVVPLFAGAKLSIEGTIRCAVGEMINLDQLTRFDGVVQTDNATQVGVPVGTSIIVDRTSGNITCFGSISVAGDLIAARAARTVRRSAQAFAAGQTITFYDTRLSSSARIYRCVNVGGTTGATVPTHTSGTATIDGIEWLFVGSGNAAMALLDLDNQGLKVRSVLKFENQSDASSSATTFGTGNGSPENVVTAPPGSIYTRRDGGANTCLYIKESGTGATGWVAK